MANLFLALGGLLYYEMNNGHFLSWVLDQVNKKSVPEQIRFVRLLSLIRPARIAYAKAFRARWGKEPALSERKLMRVERVTPQ